MLTSTLSTYKNASPANQRGAAALEAMLIVALIIIPIWAVMFNMAYNGMLHREGMNALRTGAFLYVDNLGSKDRQKAGDAAETTVNNRLFPNLNKPVNLSFSGQKQPSQEEKELNQQTDGLLANASSREAVGIAVKRNPPYKNLFKSNPDLKGSMVLSANTWTFCEMKDDDFKGLKNQALNMTSLVGDHAMWIFGGCGGGTLGSCGDKCK